MRAVFLPSSLIVLSTLIEQCYNNLFVRKLVSNGEDGKKCHINKIVYLGTLLKTVMRDVDKQYNNTMIDQI